MFNLINLTLQVEINFSGKGNIDLSSFVPSGTWDVTSGIGKVNHYADPWSPRTDVTFHIRVQRKVLLCTTFSYISCYIEILISVKLPSEYMPFVF